MTVADDPRPRLAPPCLNRPETAAYVGVGSFHAEVKAGVAGRPARREAEETASTLGTAGLINAAFDRQSGHSIGYCQQIIDGHLPRTTEVALCGIVAWEKWREHSAGPMKDEA